jgi:Conserved oligomeric complex COG6
MLAWVHQAIANENELLVSIFAPQAPAQHNTDALSTDLDTSDAAQRIDIGSLLDKVCDSF